MDRILTGSGPILIGNTPDTNRKSGCGPDINRILTGNTPESKPEVANFGSGREQPLDIPKGTFRSKASSNSAGAM